MNIVKPSIQRICFAMGISLAAMLPALAQNPPVVTLGNGAQQPASGTPSSLGSSEDGPISVAPPDSYQVPTTPLKAPTSSKPGQTSAGDDGTTVVGDKEAPIGLFITPWKDGYAEHGLDRPARFVDVDTSPIDPDTFQRRVNYYNVITDYRQAHLASGK